MKKLTMILGVLGVVSLAPMANANLQLSYSLTGAPGAAVCSTSVTASPNTSAACFVATDFNVGNGVLVNTFSSTGSQNVANSQQFSATVRIQNTGTTTQTLTLWAVDQNFTSPTAPPSFGWTSNLQFTSTTGAGSITMMSCLDTANGLAPPTTAFCAGAGSPTLANGTLNWTGTTTPPPDTVTTTVNSLAANYAMGEVITIVLGAGSSINFNASQILTQVPEPTSIVLLGGILLATAGAIRRKRNQISQV